MKNKIYTPSTGGEKGVIRLRAGKEESLLRYHPGSSQGR